jgi:FXSXX-COOH protein
MASQNEELESIVPDLRDLPLVELAKLGDSVLAHSLALYRQRLAENGALLSNFGAKI